MRQKTISKIVLSILVLFLILLADCSVTTDHLLVRIPYRHEKAVDFDKYEKIVYSPCKLTGTESIKDYDPRQEVTGFFLKDLSQAVKREIHPGEAASGEKALIVSGELKIEIKERSVIRKVKGESGGRKKAFVPVQHWTLELKVKVREASSDKELFFNTYESKLKDADPGKGEYNFKALFNKVTDKLIREITRKEKFQQRYLLLR